MDKMNIFWIGQSLHSINFPSEWGVNTPSNSLVVPQLRLHSINFPSEWGVLNRGTAAIAEKLVSIQLISPASGEYLHREVLKLSRDDRVSIQLISPASGECRVSPKPRPNDFMFPFN